MDSKAWIKSTFRVLMCGFGIAGNHWLGFRSLPKSRAQLRPNDLMFVNLALSNLITNYLVDLPDTMDFTYTFYRGEMYCGVFNFCSDLSETSSIFTTLFITVYWHQKLVGSLKRGGAPVQMDNIRLVSTLLVGSWIVAVMFSLPHLFLPMKDIGNATSSDCLENFPSLEAKQTFDLMYLILANIIPILGIFFASIQIAVTLLQNQKRIKTSSSSSSGSLLRAAKSVVTVATVFLICWIIHLILRLISTVRETDLETELASFIGAVYTCIIPYIYLHGVKKLNCSC